MIVKLISELNEIENIRFKESALFQLMIQHYSYNSEHIEYYQEYFGNTYLNYSLVVYDKSNFYIAIQIYTNNDTVSYFGQPTHIISLDTVEQTILNVAFNDLFLKLDNLNAKYINTYDHPKVLHKYFNNVINVKNNTIATINLEQSATTIKSNLRKSYKSLVNWGEKNIEVEIYDKNNADEKKFSSFHQFHITVAKRITRSDQTWQKQFNAILQGKAVMLLGYYNEELVTAIYVNYGTTTAYYGVAVNDRELMGQNIPIGQVLLYQAILKAKSDGKKLFILGDVTETIDEKVNAISKYKMGFTNTIDMNVSYQYKL